MRRLGLPVCALVALVVWWLGGADPAPRRTPGNLASSRPESAVGTTTSCSTSTPSAIPSSAVAGEGRAEAPLLEGTVADPEGHGVEGVTLRALFERHGNSGYNHYLGFETLRTDGAGRFSFEIPGSAGWATIWIDARGWVRPAALRAGPSVYDTLGRAVGWARQTIVLERGAYVEGIVEASSAVPLPDVQVEATWGGGRSSLCRTDERGRFSIVVPAEAVLVARAHRGLVTKDEGPGFPWETVPQRFEELLTHDAEAWVGPVAPGTAGVRMVLRDTVRCRMRVQGPDGALSGRVIVRVTDLAWPALGSFTCEHSVREGDLLEIPGLMPGAYAVEVLPRQQEWLPSTFVATLPGEPVDVRCAQALRVDGILEGENLKDFEITWTGPCNERLETALQSGRTLRVKAPAFTLLGIGDGTGDLYARRLGDPRFALVTGVRPGRGVVRLALAPGQTIRGRVDSAPGLKQAALSVRALRGLVEERARVAGDGTFSIVGLPPGTFRVELVTGAWSSAWSRRGGRVTGEWTVKWVHDARDDVPAGAEDVRLRVRLPATEPDGAGS